MKFPVNLVHAAHSGPPAPLASLKNFKRIIGLTGVLLLAGVLQGCSAIRLAYNNSPELAYWYLDGYADFSDAQSVQVKDALVKLQAWHRQAELPAYIDLLHKVKLKMPNDLDAAQACEVFGDARRKMQAIAGRAEPAVAALATTLTPAQMKHMEQKFDKTNETYREDFVDATAKASRAKRYKEAVKRAEMLYGPLEGKQLERIGHAIDHSGFNANISYSERVRRQKDILETFRTLAATAGGTPTAAEKSGNAVKGLMDRAFNSPDPLYRDYFEKLTQGGCRSFADLHNATTAAQRSKAVATLTGYEQDLVALTGVRARN